MTRLDAAVMQEQDARRALTMRLDELSALLDDCKRAVLCGKALPVKWVPAKAISVDEAAEIWDATRWAVDNIRGNGRAA